MDTTTCFNLNQALDQWRHSLAAHESLSGERAAELETHLRETCDDLQARGLREEEAFWLAQRRLGDQSKLAQQFASAAPSGVWRTRIFWMAIGMVVIPSAQQLASLVSGVATFAFSFASPTVGGLMALVLPLSLIGGMLWLLMGLAMGRWPAFSRRLDGIFSRGQHIAWKVIWLGLLLLAIRGLLMVAPFVWFRINGPAGWTEMRNGFIAAQGLNLLWPIALVVLAAIYAPKRLAPPSIET